MVYGHLQRHGSQRSVHDPGAAAAGYERRDREAQLVDQPGVGQLPVERRPALRQHHPGAATVQLGEDLCGLGSLRRQSHQLGHGFEALDGLGAAALPVRISGGSSPGCCSANSGRSRSRSRLELTTANRGRSAPPRGSPGSPGGRPGPGQAVALNPHRPRRGHDPVGAGPHGREDGLVGGLPSAPLVPSTATAPSAEAIMLIMSQGRPAGLGRASDG